MIVVVVVVPVVSKFSFRRPPSSPISTEPFGRIILQEGAEASGGDIGLYQQLHFRHSRQITGFRSHSACWECFIERYHLTRDIVENLPLGCPLLVS